MPNYIGSRSIPCPICRREVGEPCKGFLGLSRGTPHLERALLAAKQAKAEDYKQAEARTVEGA